MVSVHLLIPTTRYWKIPLTFFWNLFLVTPHVHTDNQRQQLINKILRSCCQTVSRHQIQGSSSNIRHHSSCLSYSVMCELIKLLKPQLWWEQVQQSPKHVIQSQRKDHSDPWPGRQDQCLTHSLIEKLRSLEWLLFTCGSVAAVGTNFSDERFHVWLHHLILGLIGTIKLLNEKRFLQLSAVRHWNLKKRWSLGSNNFDDYDLLSIIKSSSSFFCWPQLLCNWIVNYSKLDILKKQPIFSFVWEKFHLVFHKGEDGADVWILMYEVGGAIYWINDPCSRICQLTMTIIWGGLFSDESTKQFSIFYTQKNFQHFLLVFRKLCPQQLNQSFLHLIVSLRDQIIETTLLCHSLGWSECSADDLSNLFDTWHSEVEFIIKVWHFEIFWLKIFSSNEVTISRELYTTNCFTITSSVQWSSLLPPTTRTWKQV